MLLLAVAVEPEVQSAIPIPTPAAVVEVVVTQRLMLWLLHRERFTM